MPAPEPIRKPSVAAVRVASICNQIEPKAVPSVNHCTRRSQMADGLEKKNGSIQYVPASCQLPSQATTSPTRTIWTRRFLRRRRTRWLSASGVAPADGGVGISAEISTPGAG